MAILFLFLFIFVFSIQLKAGISVGIIFADANIRTVYPCCQKRPLYQLSHNHWRCNDRFFLQVIGSLPHFPEDLKTMERSLQAALSR